MRKRERERERGREREKERERKRKGPDLCRYFFCLLKKTFNWEGNNIVFYLIFMVTARA